MNDFHQRWQTLATSARRTHSDIASELPFGFATRIVAQFQETPAESWADLFAALGLRAVLTSAVVFCVSAVLVVWQMDVVSLTPTWVDAPLSPQLFLP
jgi:hypothetical protein